MATKATLEAANAALKAQVEDLLAKVDTLAGQVTAATVSPKVKAEPKAKPLVTRGYFKTQDAQGIWHDDTSRPCIIINVPGAKARKITPENFEKELALHAKLESAYKALA